MFLLKKTCAIETHIFAFIYFIFLHLLAGGTAEKTEKRANYAELE